MYINSICTCFAFKDRKCHVRVQRAKTHVGHRVHDGKEYDKIISSIAFFLSRISVFLSFIFFLVFSAIHLIRTFSNLRRRSRLSLSLRYIKNCRYYRLSQPLFRAPPYAIVAMQIVR